MVPNVATWFLVVSFYIQQIASGSLTCLSCKGAVLPIYCDTVVRCGQHESCFSDTFVTSSGYVRYDLGCRDTLQCTGPHTSSSSSKKRFSSTDSLLSSACCTGELCNAKTKQHPGYSQPRGPICFNCQSQAHYDDCNQITICSQDEACQTMPNVFGKRESSTLNKREAVCTQCCNSDLCNDRCNASAIVSSPCASRPCLGGSCRETGSGYVCDCNPGYTGTNCEKVIQSNPCSLNPCKNGVCVNHGSHYTCKCYRGYTGQNCDKAITTPSTVRTITATPETTLLCEDKIPNCAAYSTDFCWNKRNHDWDSFYCPKFCNTCKIACADRDSDCPVHANNCGDREWARFHCANTCNICKGASGTSGVAHGTTSVEEYIKCAKSRFYQTTSTPKPVYPPGNGLKSTRCCETGRPIMVDPVSGRTICSCQLKPNASAYLSRVPGLPDAAYSSGSSHVFQPNVVIGNDPTSALYSMGLKTDRSPDGGPPAPSGGPAPYYLEHLMATHPYSAYYPGFDFNNARRKNATRETTSALKAWLYEHRKNPYPTKGEKIMLAIITRMTLTQVSTWFANARRRLKKENKIDDKDDSLSEIDLQEKDDEHHITCDISSGEDETDNSKHPTDLSDISDNEEQCLGKTVSSPSGGRLLKPVERLDMLKDYQRTSELSETKRHVSNYVTDLPSASSSATPEDKLPRVHKASRDHMTSQNETAGPTRPKIWSISEIINSSKTSSSG